MAWYNRHKGLAGAATGGAIGSVVPVLGTFVGAVAGALIGPLVIDDEKPDHERQGTSYDPDARGHEEVGREKK